MGDRPCLPSVPPVCSGRIAKSPGLCAESFTGRNSLHLGIFPFPLWNPCVIEDNGAALPPPCLHDNFLPLFLVCVVTTSPSFSLSPHYDLNCAARGALKLLTDILSLLLLFFLSHFLLLLHLSFRLGQSRGRIRLDSYLAASLSQWLSSAYPLPLPLLALYLSRLLAFCPVHLFSWSCRLPLRRSALTPSDRRNMFPRAHPYRRSDSACLPYAHRQRLVDSPGRCKSFLISHVRFFSGFHCQLSYAFNPPALLLLKS